MNTYARLPVEFERGEGAWLWDTSGKKYLDAVSGVAVCSLGHAHPAVVDAVCEQAHKLIHTSNLYSVKRQHELADRLIQHSGMDNVFFGNSGAEANEAAIKIARLHGHQKGIDDPAIIVTENSFHGRTLATLSATGNRKVQAGFEPLVHGFIRVPYNDVEAIKHVAKHTSNIVAVLVEPIQGEGGVNIPADDYLNQLRELCDQRDWLLMLDEIQTGIGRTGQWFAFHHNNIQPDVITVAKALGNGVPIGACLAHGNAASLFKPGNHGSTFGGNPLACAAALAVLNTMESENLPQHAANMGAKIVDALRANLSQLPDVKEVRGKGMIIGIELSKPCGDIVKHALDEGLLINVTANNVIRLLPPLNLTDEQANILVSKLSQLVSEFVAPVTA